MKLLLAAPVASNRDRLTFLTPNDRSTILVLENLLQRQACLVTHRASGHVIRALVAEQNINCSSRALGSQLGCSLIVLKQAANGYLVATLEEATGGEETNWPPYLTMPAAQDKCPL